MNNEHEMESKFDGHLELGNEQLQRIVNQMKNLRSESKFKNQSNYPDEARCSGLMSYCDYLTKKY
jgi:hypothetical protein